MLDPLLTSTLQKAAPAAATPAFTPRPARSSEEQRAGFDPKDVIHILLKRLWLVLAIVVSVPTAVWLYARKLPRQYQATATMVVDSVTPQYMGQQFRDMVELESNNWTTFKEYLETQYYVIRSRTLAIRVGEGLCRRATAEGADGSGPLAIGIKTVLPALDCKSQASIEKVAPSLTGLLALSTPSRESRVVNVSIETIHPELAAALANGYVEAFVSRNLEQRRSATGHATDWLGGEYQSLQRQLTEAEERLVRFKMEHNILKVNIEDQQNRVVTQMQRYGDELQNVRLKLIALRAVKDQHAKLLSDEDPLQNLPPPNEQFGTGGTFQDLRRQYMEAFQKKVELAGRYLEKHPLVLAQDARIVTIRDELRREARLAERAITAQYDTLIQQEQELRRAVDATTKEALTLEARAIEYNRLKREFERLRLLTDRVGGRETEADLASRLNTSNVKPLDPAQVPQSPIGPNVRVAVLTALGIALLLSVFLCFAIEFLDSTVKTQDEVEQVLGMPFLGIIPHLPDGALNPPSGEGPKLPKELFIAEHPKSTVAECCRVIRTNLLFMSPERPARTLLVTSAGPQEGKSMSSVSLALTMAQSGSRVLLVDTDMRRPRLHKVFGIPSGGVGITSVIAGEVAPLDAVKATGQENLFLMPCGPLPPNPAELLQTDRFRQIAAELGAAFDKVVFDSPPVGAVTDPLILSQSTDGVVLIVKSHKTSREILRRAARQLRDLGAKMLGCVLNDLDLESRRKGYGYPYYYYYKSGYYRYGYHSNEEAGAKPGASAASAAPIESSELAEMGEAVPPGLWAEDEGAADVGDQGEAMGDAKGKGDSGGAA